jgi:hypothetical protein
VIKMSLVHSCVGTLAKHESDHQGMRTYRAKGASQGLRAKYRSTRETGLVNAGGSAALLLPKKGAVKRYRCVSSGAAVSEAPLPPE